MANTSKQSEIDKKKEKSNSSNKSSYYSDIINFVFTVFILFIIIIVYYSSSGLLLYACKLGQSNILPTDAHCFPYTDNKLDIQPIQTNIFTTFNDPPLSMKMKFPYNEENAANKLLDMFREYKNEPKSNFLANYFISIMESVVQFNYSAFNTILNMLNGLPEILIILFGPIIVGILSTIIFLLDHIYLIYLWFAKMGWFFKTNANDSNTGKPKWTDVTFLSPFNYWCALSLVILFVFIFFFSFPLLSIIAALSMMWCMFSCITYTAEMNGTNITAATIVQDIFKYYKIPIMGFFSFLVIVTAFSKLGTYPGIFSLLTLALIYYGIISIDIFNPIYKEKLSLLVSYKQAKKTCSYTEPTKEKRGLFYNMIFGQSGGDIAKELKNISKRVNNRK
jgi:hypothetical protein